MSMERVRNPSGIHMTAMSMTSAARRRHQSAIGMPLASGAASTAQSWSLFSIADYWQRIGVAVDPVLIPRQRQPDRPYRATYPGIEMVRQGSDLEQPARAHSAQTPLPENNFTGNNRTRYRNPDLDGFIDRYFTTVPQGERLQWARQIVHHMTDQVIWMGIFYDSQPVLISNRLQNVTAGAARLSSPVWNAQDWDTR